MLRKFKIGQLRESDYSLEELDRLLEEETDLYEILA